ncbi:MAG: RnfABCDGE type electron transport complex subunit G [Candidatus Omnitrophica bacterium]|nr:RnfABCDGE type electron transport complex subunit G [Candidatus Omnitrophota bacterium]MDD5592731.1 RnfABCDGE type electron transport complex subunit G [Candidatus Omnitrophota bacterium]
MLRYGLILALICAVAAGLLASVNSLTKSRIIAQAQAEEEAGLKEVMPQAVRFEAAKSGEAIVYYNAYDEQEKIIGTVFKASAKGYSSQIETMAGVTSDGKITNIKILNQNETPGLGSRVAQPAFTSQFSNKDIRGLSEVQAITGATISSKAVMDSVREKLKDIQELTKNAK